MATIDRHVPVQIPTDYDMVIHAELVPKPISSLDAKQTSKLLEDVLHGKKSEFETFDNGVFDKAMRYFFAAVVIGWISHGMRRWARRG